MGALMYAPEPIPQRLHNFSAPARATPFSLTGDKIAHLLQTVPTGLEIYRLKLSLEAQTEDA